MGIKKSLVHLLKDFGLYRASKLTYMWLQSLNPEKRVERNNMAAFYSQFVQRDDLCFDVGAHVGNRTEIFLKIGAKVVAVEPQESCFETLLLKYEKNPNVILINKGLAESVGTQKLLVGSIAQVSTMSTEWLSSVTKSGRFTTHEWNKEELVPVTTLDELIKNYGVPKFCKIDVEGYELQILKGLSQPIGCLSFEFTPECLDIARKCVEHLSNLGTVVFNYSLGESMSLSLPDWISSESMQRCLDDLYSAYDKDKTIFGDIYAKFLKS